MATYLEQFESNCTGAGGTVHWATDAAEARAIILQILREEKAEEVIKIKTMTSAEIELNPALKAAGIAAFETDLAEMILQLGDDESSHIVVPALHVNRRQVREIFAQRMGLPQLSDDPQALTAAARTYLRQEIPICPHGHQRRELPHRRKRFGRDRRIRGQRPNVPHIAPHAHRACGHRERCCPASPISK